MGAAAGAKWDISFHALTDVQFHPVHGGGSPIEGDLYLYLKLQSQLQIAVAWRYRNRVQEQVPFFDSVDWDSTLLNIHGGNLPGSLATSVSMCTSRAYRIKILHGMLPTAARLRVTHPDVYPDDLCPRCLHVTEDSSHVWACQCSAEAVEIMVAKGTSLFWELAKRHKFSSVPGETCIFPGPHTVFDVIRGVIPLEWSQILCRGRVSSRGVRLVVLEIGKYFVSTAFAKIWKPRCDAQVARERQLQITQQVKRRGMVHRERVRVRVQGKRRTTYLAHVQAGKCPVCQVTLAVHVGGDCPPLVNQAHVIADRLLQEHFQSQCVLPSVFNPLKVIKALDSLGGDTQE
jgi:hypothetical protein